MRILRKSEDELKKLRDEFARKRNRLETLQELDEKRAVYAPQVQKLFAEESKIGVKFAGTLADRLNVEEKAEKAVENLFGNFLQAVLVDTEKDARKVSSWLAANDVGRIAVLVTPEREGGGRGVKGTGRQHCEFSGSFRGRCRGPEAGFSARDVGANWSRASTAATLKTGNFSLTTTATC